MARRVEGRSGATLSLFHVKEKDEQRPSLNPDAFRSTGDIASDFSAQEVRVTLKASGKYTQLFLARTETFRFDFNHMNREISRSSGKFAESNQDEIIGKVKSS